MKIIAFRDNEKYYHTIHKLKKMEHFTKELRNMLENPDKYEEEDDDEEDDELSKRRGRMSRREREDDDDIEIVRRGSRYSY